MTAPSDRPLTEREYQALAHFRRGLRRFLSFSESAADSEGITPAQHQLLLAVRGHPGDGAPSVTDLADALQRRRHSTVELIDRAEDHDLVVSHPDPSDRRRRLIDLTPHGSRVIERLSALHRSELRSFDADFVQVLRDLDDTSGGS